ncbi:YheC/YheD family protein [Alicyclobacillus mali]|uniref:YheC/YheD family protein n=1 Tax=Alicyclobacillus mali (ex Roth et al. 2021) TaxID=1123961 RepID=A0ABS0F1J7_9BACL|nr:YheC/YheD family protein [Alicyclobacillus mali (ex Roth et al. 2021)]MBF8377156.1 YheC/YheD family protein [Alicyclobacillus mali (ex Roth et al. 2021)]MCL6488001.1 YheC/YheD family protein [Alicyclobacillus mali (ex Roth et al. 2021)]
MRNEGGRTHLSIYVDGPSPGRKRFGDQTRLFEDLILLGRDAGVEVQVLTPGDLSARRAHTFTGMEWVLTQPAGADVVLRRSGLFHRQPALAARELVALRRQGLLHTLPRQSGQKWRLYTWLRTDHRLRSHLPPTWLCARVEDLIALLAAQDDLYLKPLNGTQGQGIYRVRKRAGRVELWSAAASAPLVMSTPSELGRAWPAGSWIPSVAQQTIPLAQIGNRPFDLRWLVCDGDDPTIIARVARVGTPQAVTTNIHTGSEPRFAEDVLEDAFGTKAARDLVGQLDEIALAVAGRARQRFGPYAELGLDLAVREDGRVYFIELNPTPGRKMLRHLDPEVHRLSLQALLEYAIQVRQRRGG